MVSSITQLQGKMLQQLEKIFIEYSTDMTKMAELRAYYYNGGDMLELVRYQTRVPKEEKEEIIYSSNKMWVEERKRQKELGCLADMKTYSIANAQIRKMLNCKHQICG